MTSDRNPDSGTDAAAETLARAISRADTGKGLPPVHLWDPGLSGELDMRIARDGTWWYLGSPIRRLPLVRLFASVLKREEGRHYLVTPVEKWAITVDDAPFVAVDVTTEDPGPDQALVFETNVGDRTVAGPDNAIRVERDPETGEPAPYVHVRRGLEALIDRKSFYRLVEAGSRERSGGTLMFGFRSGGVFFPVMPSAEMDPG